MRLGFPRRWICSDTLMLDVLGVGILLFGLACDRTPTSPDSTKNSDAPANRPAAPAQVSPGAASDFPVAAATHPTTRPAKSSSVMTIDQTKIEFPGALLRVSTSDGRVVALLYSDDPRDAISDQYTGNSFYFEMQLDAADPKEFASSVWQSTASSIDREDSPYGVFLDGHRRQLQPMDVKIQFEPAGEGLTTVWISGKFLLIDVEDVGKQPQALPLVAKLVARTLLKD